MVLSNSDATLTIDLDAIGSNYFLLRNKVYPSVCAAVVKADAYGLGADEVAPFLAQIGCNDFFVAHLDEALALRRVLQNNENIYVFHGIRAGQEEFFLHNNIIPVLNTRMEIELWKKAGRDFGVNALCVIHIDTGMNRLGLDFEYAVNHATEIQELNIAFIMTHMSCADISDSDSNVTQLTMFSSLKELYHTYKFSLANSPSIFLGEDYHFDSVRPGCALYGVNPSPNASNPMNNVVSLSTKILQVRHCRKGSYVGYGASYQTSRDSTIATIAIGYADGYLRSLSNSGNVFIDDNPVPIVGRVSMDLVTIDVTDVPDMVCYEGKDVEIIGDNITVDDVAKNAGTIGYEVLTSLGTRYHKKYVANTSHDCNDCVSSQKERTILS